MIDRKRIFAALCPPSQCALCGLTHRRSTALCANCILLLPKLEDCCRYCALPLLDRHGTSCGRCIQKRPIYSRAQALYHYASPLSDLLHRYKYYQDLFLAAVFAEQMLVSLPDFIASVDWMIPVPLHRTKLSARGFHPVAYIARHLSRATKVPCLYRHCGKHKNTKAQVGLSKHERVGNLKGSFYSKAITGQRVVLIDDLMTTGSTANEVSQVLLDAGASAVYVWCLARTA